MHCSKVDQSYSWNERVARLLRNNASKDLYSNRKETNARHHIEYAERLAYTKPNNSPTTFARHPLPVHIRLATLSVLATSEAKHFHHQENKLGPKTTGYKSMLPQLKNHNSITSKTKHAPHQTESTNLPPCSNARKTTCYISLSILASAGVRISTFLLASAVLYVVHSLLSSFALH